MDYLHPGKILFEEYMTPRRLSSSRLAAQLEVNHTSVWELTSGKRGISAEMALRLAKFFQTTPEFWLEMQIRYELKIARQKMQFENANKRENKRENANESANENENASEKGNDKENGFENDIAFDTASGDGERLENWKERMTESKLVKDEDLELVFKIYEMLGAKPVSFDEIVYALDDSDGRVLPMMTLLELEGWVKRLPGDWFTRVS